MAELNVTLNSFYGNILQLLQVYKWQETILPLTIAHYLALAVRLHQVEHSPNVPGKVLQPSYPSQLIVFEL